MSTRSRYRTSPLKARVREAASTAILEAAEAVAAERGLEAASCAAIAERAGVAVGTLYNYFPDRDTLLSSLFRSRREELVPRLEEAAQAAAALPFEERLRTYLRTVLAIFEERRQFLAVVFAVDQKALKIKDRKPVVKETIAGALREILTPSAGGAAETHAQLLMGAMMQLFRWRIERGEPLVPDADLVAGIYLHGGAPR